MRQTALEKLENGVVELQSKFDALKTEADLRNILIHYSFSSMKRFYLLNSITKPLKKSEIIGPLRGKLQGYPDLLKIRNTMAHAKCLEKPDGSYVFEGDDKTYNDEEFVSLRQDLIRTEATLNDLLSAIDAGSLN